MMHEFSQTEQRRGVDNIEPRLCLFLASAESNRCQYSIKMNTEILNLFLILYVLFSVQFWFPYPPFSATPETFAASHRACLWT